jgi:hypothetical protein
VQLSERESDTASIKWVDAAVATDVPAQPVSPTPKSEPGGTKWGAIVSTASAVVLVGFGIGAYAASGGAQTTLFAECKTMIDCSSLKTPVRAWDAVALGSWIGAAGFTTLAIALWLKPSSRGRAHDPSAPSARIELRPLGFAVVGSF